jgi:YD repeat-containing protein
MTARQPDHDRLLSPGEFASIVRVGVTTIARWDGQGRLTVTRTPGGTRRYLEAEARAIAAGTFRCIGCGYRLDQCPCLLHGAAARAS